MKIKKFTLFEELDTKTYQEAAVKLNRFGQKV